MIAKPDHLFDRDSEWRHLAAFVTREPDRPQLGVVSGRRRQGKTYLLEALTRECDGFYFGATEATETESLALFANALSEYLDAPVPLRFTGWDEAVTYLFSIAASLRGPVVIDEFPYLCKASPALPSILQRELDRGVSRQTPISILLCGSAMSVMGGLLGGSAPLRGRANLELVLRPFEYPLAARFWRVAGSRLAVLLHAIVGGTPAYRRFVNDRSPDGLDDFDDWVLETVLDPGTPLFREARYLLEEEADVRDTALYHSILAAVASGNNTRGGIAGYIGRKAADIGHHLNVLEDSCLIRRDADLFRSGRSRYRIAEPLIVFYEVVMRPRWGLLESGRAGPIWADAAPRFSSQVVGPHFEQMCREFAMLAPSRFFGDLPGDVGAGVVSGGREQIEVDVVVLGPAIPGEPRRVLSLGECKWGEAMGVRHVDRLRRARDLLGGRGYDVRDTVLACYSGIGFDERLQDNSDSIALIGLDTLYEVD
ncbi:ATP-binding protein [Actinoallomurus sp. NPDC052308]|uniref:ATP-binding protein n=1 Tax=Actinoallomurus sp. NPDC052308 TaxID=3155530 RepID=UPI0034393FA5